MRFTRVVRTPSVLMVLGLALALACAADDVIININPEGDSIQFSVPWDSIDEVTDTIIVDGDTIVLIVVDTVIGPVDTVLVPIVDTVIQSDTVVNTVVDTLTLTDTVFQNVVDTVVDGGDTAFVVVTDTVVEVNDVITVTYDTTLVTDTIVETVYDTVIQFDTVIETRTDTVIEVDTVLLVDTVITSPSSLDFGVNVLNIEVGQTATVQVTFTNALGLPVPGEDITWFSENSVVATVDAGGVVMGKAAGVTLVFAIAEAAGLSATLPVQVVPVELVTPPPTGTSQPFFSDDFESGDLGSAVVTDGASFWGTPSDGGNGTRPTVTTGRARSGSYALELGFGPDAAGKDSRSEQRINIKRGIGYPELWFEYWFFIPDNHFHRNDIGPDNNKFIRLWGGAYGDGNPKVGASLRPDAGASYLYGQFGSSQVGISDTGAAYDAGLVWRPAYGNDTSFPNGTWTRIRFHFRLAESPYSEDGVVAMWVDDQIVFQNEGLDIFGTGGVGNAFDQAYLMGAANSGFSDYTKFFIDDLKIWSTNPEW